MAVDVFRRLRMKLALSITLVLALVLAVLIGSFNAYLDSSNRRLADNFIEELVENEGERKHPNGGPMNDMGTPPDWKPDAEDGMPGSGTNGKNQGSMNPPPKPTGNFQPGQMPNGQRPNGAPPPDLRQGPNGEQMPNGQRPDGNGNNVAPPELDQQNNDAYSSLFPIRNNYMGFRNFYTAKLDESGNITEVVNDFSDDFDSDQLESLVKTVFNLKKKHG